MIKSTSLVFLFLISLASAAQVSNTVFPNNPNQKKISTNKQRTTTIDKQRLDSIVSSLDKDLYTYDAAGNQIRRIRYEWKNGSNVWIPYNRFEYEYDGGGNEILYEQYGWDDINNVYSPDFRYEREYDVNKNLTSQITYSWYGSPSNWHPLKKSVNTFGSNGKISSIYNYSWAGGVLMADNYVEFTYNNKNLLIEETQYSPSPSDFMQSQTIYTYNANDNLISEISSHYDYNSNSKMDSGSKYEYTYDSQNNVTLLVESKWNAGIDDWEMVYKTENEFDLQNNQTASIQSDWDTQTKIWVYSYKSVYSYDNTYAITDLIIPQEIDERLKHKLISFISYGFDNGDWEQMREYTVYYTSNVTTGIANMTSYVLTVYPNPANDRVVFTNNTSNDATLELFNQQGSLAYKKKIVMNQPVSVEGLAQGIYFYRISSMNAESYNGTLIIE
jgi:hypothetical protein